MSGVFDLDEDGARALDDQVRSNPFDVNQMDVPMWQGIGQQSKRLMSASASAGRSLAMAGAPVAMAIDKATSVADDISGRNARREALGLAPTNGVGAADWYFRNVVDDLGQDAVDAWAPDAGATGAAASVMGTAFHVLGSVPQIIGAPQLFLTDATLSPATDVIRQGGSTGAALGTGAVSLAANAVGMRLPAAWGNTLAQRIGTGAAANVAVGAVQNAATAGILKADGLDKMAASYDPLSAQALTLDALMGAAFGAAAHLATPTQRNAVLTARNSDHFANRTMPGRPVNGDAAVAHQDAMSEAMRQFDAGEPINVLGKVGPDDFVPRWSDGGAYSRMLIALESGGRADAKAPASSATGLHQFTSGTWLATVKKAAPAWAKGMSKDEILAARTDPAKSSEMEAVLRNENWEALSKAGQDAGDPFNLYAAHHFGTGKAVEFAKAAGDTPMREILGSDQIRANKYLANLTKDQAIANWTERARKAGVEIEQPSAGMLAEIPRDMMAMIESPPMRPDRDSTATINDELRQAPRVDDSSAISALRDDARQIVTDPDMPAPKIEAIANIPPADQQGQGVAKSVITEPASQAREAVTENHDMPHLAMARKAAADRPDAVMLSGFDADGAPQYRGVSDAIAEIEADRVREHSDAAAYEAAVSCFLRHGDAG